MRMKNGDDLFHKAQKFNFPGGAFRHWILMGSYRKKVEIFSTSLALKKRVGEAIRGNEDFTEPINVRFGLLRATWIDASSKSQALARPRRIQLPRLPLFFLKYSREIFTLLKFLNKGGATRTSEKFSPSIFVLCTKESWSGKNFQYRDSSKFRNNARIKYAFIDASESILGVY